MSSTNDFAIEIKSDRVFFFGCLQENADLSPLTGAPQPLRINLSQLREINSAGIRNFCLFLQALDTDFAYEEVPPEFLDTLNMVPVLLKAASGHKGTVDSVLLPYECLNCGHEELILINRPDITIEDDEINVPKQKCTKCGEETEEEIPPTDLLHFMLD